MDAGAAVGSQPGGAVQQHEPAINASHPTFDIYMKWLKKKVKHDFKTFS